MFNKNKYTKWYFKICSKSYEGFTETHHIIPKCLGGSDDKSNLVALSPKAHFICHWLLTKMVITKADREKMYYAFNFMLLKPKDLKKHRYYPCSRVYEIAKKYMHLNNPVDHLDVREKISLSRKRNWQNPTKAMLEGIEKMRKTKKGKSPPNKGIKGKYKLSEETRKKLTAQRTGRKWYNDGNKSFFIHSDKVKPHYKLGRK